MERAHQPNEYENDEIISPDIDKWDNDDTGIMIFCLGEGWKSCLGYTQPV
jgi:hypothetical protein